MLTRLKVRGFKNLVDVEVQFGPFTCIAGANGVGKSNLFDVIQFLRDLTEYSLVEAAARVRDPDGRSGDILGIFTKTPSGQPAPIFLEADFIVPRKVYDDFNREANPTATYLAYALELRYVAASGSKPERLELARESLDYIPASTARKRLGFPHSRLFRESVIANARRAPYISTEPEDGRITVKLHQDGGSAGRPFKVPAISSPKTIVGGNNTNDYPTVLAARREMQSWTLLQLEPSALRQSDTFSADPRVAANGAHLPATLLRLKANSEIADQLSELLDDVSEVKVDKDDSRRTLTLQVSGRNGIAHPARALSDGTLRFLALAILAADPEAGRLLCLEEPENGIHPSRIPTILGLLKNMVVDTDLVVDNDNPLKQVIVNTHSPTVVSALSIDDLVVVSPVRRSGIQHAAFDCVEDSWRSKSDTGAALPQPKAALASILDYVNTAPGAPRSMPRVGLQSDKKTIRDYAYDQMKLPIDWGNSQ